MRFLVLHNIRSHHNVGSMFRTAEGAGVTKIYLVGYTPAPIDRFGRVVPEIAKTSLGASTMVPWELVSDDVSLVTTLQTTGVTVVAVEQTANSISLTDFTVPPDVAYIMWNEVVGVPPAWCVAADYVVEIPMYGQKESLNVGVAAGIVLYKS